MSRESIKDLIELVPEQDIDTIYRVIVKFIPSEIPNETTLEAMRAAEAGEGEVFHGSTREMLESILED